MRGNRHGQTVGDTRGADQGRRIAWSKPLEEHVLGIMSG